MPPDKKIHGCLELALGVDGLVPKLPTATNL